MSERDDGRAAFPRIASRGGSEFDGMSLRDYFAAKVMLGMIAGAGEVGASFGRASPNDNDKYASAAYAVADAMLKERSKP